MTKVDGRIIDLGCFLSFFDVNEKVAIGDGTFKGRCFCYSVLSSLQIRDGISCIIKKRRFDVSKRLLRSDMCGNFTSGQFPKFVQMFVF